MINTTTLGYNFVEHVMEYKHMAPFPVRPAYRFNLHYAQRMSLVS